MWNTKFFKTEKAARAWIARNTRRYVCDLLFVKNGWAVEYKLLRRVY